MNNINYIRLMTEICILQKMLNVLPIRNLNQRMNVHRHQQEERYILTRQFEECILQNADENS